MRYYKNPDKDDTQNLVGDYWQSQSLTFWTLKSPAGHTKGTQA